MGRIATFTLWDPYSKTKTPIRIEEDKLTTCPYCSGTGLVQRFYSEGFWQTFPRGYAMPCYDCEGNGGVIPENNQLIKEPFSRKQILHVEFVYPPPNFLHLGPVATMFFHPRSKLPYADWFSDVPFPKTEGIGTMLTTNEWTNNIGIRGRSSEKRPHTFI